jgi:3-oxoacyl-[acyl-carrier protein] reductase
MQISLAEHVAIITGGAQGIGAETARVFAAAGATVVLWDMAEAAGEALAAELGGSFRRVNVANRDECRAAATAAQEQYGRIDILINNAGILRDAQLLKSKEGVVTGEMAEADFDAVIGVNLKGVFNSTQAVVPYMIQRRYGRIINASSVVGLYGNFGQTNYVATKAGVIGMTKVWARELGRHNITVNAIAPGFIGTDMVQQMPKHILDGMVARTPIGRLGEPRDIANAYLFLASELASFISGTTLSVDGGVVVGT